MQVKPKIFFLLIIMSVIGLISAITVLYEIQVVHTLPPLCTIPTASISGVAINCAKVLLSPYGEINGVPLELLAAVWFIINISLVSVVSFTNRKTSRKTLKFLFFWRFLGILIVPYLVYLELFVVKSICLYCTVMHIAIIIDFVIISYFLFSSKSHLYIEYRKPD